MNHDASNDYEPSRQEVEAASRSIHSLWWDWYDEQEELDEQATKALAQFTGEARDALIAAHAARPAHRTPRVEDLVALRMSVENLEFKLRLAGGLPDIEGHIEPSGTIGPDIHFVAGWNAAREDIARRLGV